MTRPQMRLLLLRYNSFRRRILTGLAHKFRRNRGVQQIFIVTDNIDRLLVTDGSCDFMMTLRKVLCGSI